MKEFEHTTRCPYCGYGAERASNTDDDHQPGDGDVTLCIRCGRIGVFDSTVEGGARRTTALEAARFAADPRISKLRLAWAMMDQRRRAGRIPPPSNEEKKQA